MKKFNTHIPDKIKLAYDTNMLKRNKKYYTYWEYHKHPNLLILGNTGSGKSYFLRTLVARIALHIPTAQAYICDFKNEFMEKSHDNSKFYGYTDVLTGFNEFYAIMEERLKGCKNREFRLLLIDEVVSWYNSMDKKDSENVRKRMANLLFMCRSLNLHCVLGAQRGMAENFSHGSRDSLNVIFLGSPSKESIGSFVSQEDSSKIKPRGIGEGYTIFDGEKPRAITVPKINSMDRLNELLTEIATR